MISHVPDPTAGEPVSPVEQIFDNDMGKTLTDEEIALSDEDPERSIDKDMEEAWTDEEKAVTG
eukprot:4021959-Amphidinium_carterae.1